MAQEAYRISKWISETVVIDTLVLLAQATFDALVIAAEKSRTPRHVLLSQGGEALHAATQAAAAARGVGDSYRTAEALLVSGRVAFALMQPAVAQAAAAEATPIFDELGDKAGGAGSRLLEAQVHLNDGRLQDAYDAATQAKALAKAAGEQKVEQLALRIIQQTPPRPAELPTTVVQASQAAEAAVAPAPVAVAGTPATQETALSLSVVKELVMKVGKDILGEEEEDLTFDLALMDAGLDSLSALSFRNQLNVETKLKLPGTLMFDYPTMNDVAAHIAELSRRS